MVQKKRIAASIMLLGMASLLAAQVVEKYSASFSFPTGLTSGLYGKISTKEASFFRSSGHVSVKGFVRLEWSAPAGASTGFITIYKFNGAVVKRYPVTGNKGMMLCDIGRSASGIYMASLRSGSYKQTIKLAVSKQGD